MREKTVYYRQDLLDLLLTRAHESKKEIFCWLFGHRAGDEVILCAVRFPPVHSTESSVYVPPVEYRRARAYAKKSGTEWLGSAHSHPGGSPVQSYADFRSARQYRELISIIVATGTLGGTVYDSFTVWWGHDAVPATTRTFTTACPVCHPPHKRHRSS